jgi:Flp pilus assembly protein TadG
MKETMRNQRGAVLVTFAILLVALLGFAALATEAGRWYLVRSELSKAVDAASLAGAKNISNPYVTVNTIAQEVGNENFPAGQLGTPISGAGSVSFTITTLTNNKIKVDGRVNAIAILARLFGIDQVATASSGVAQKNKVEIMMVLDRSGSMAGSPISKLKTAAKSFLSFFTETQDEDKMGLISFATGVTVDQQLGINFVNAMTTKINAMTATGATNAEDAIDQVDGPNGFTDQTGIPGDQRVQQYLLFFTDGHPTAFRGKFRRNGTDYNDAVVMGTGNYCDTVYDYMGHTDSENFYPTSTLTPTPTGDGNKTGGSPLTSCGSPSHRYLNTRWYIFGDPKYGLHGYDPLQCSIPESVLAPYICNTAKSMAIDHAQELKDKGIKIYTIGLEGNGGVDHGFLGQVASGPGYEYYAPTSDDLEGIFNAVAKEIKLRLVQ